METRVTHEIMNVILNIVWKFNTSIAQRKSDYIDAKAAYYIISEEGRKLPHTIIKKDRLGNKEKIDLWLSAFRRGDKYLFNIRSVERNKLFKTFEIKVADD